MKRILITLALVFALFAPAHAQVLESMIKDGTILARVAANETIGGIWLFTNNFACPLIYGSSAADGDITIEGTSSGTKASSYVILQPTGGFVGIGTTAPEEKLHVSSSTADGKIIIETTAAAKNATMVIKNPTGRSGTVTFFENNARTWLFGTTPSNFAISDYSTGGWAVDLTVDYNTGSVGITANSDQIILDSDAAAGVTTTLTDSATAARVITFPDLTGTVVLGPATAVDNTIARYDGTTGKLLQGYTSGAPTVSDTGDAVFAGLDVSGTLTVDTIDDSGATGISFTNGILPSADNSLSCGTSDKRWSDVRSVKINGADIGFANNWKLREYPATAEDIGKPDSWFREHANQGVQLLDENDKVIAVFHKNGTLYVDKIKPLSALGGQK